MIVTQKQTRLLSYLLTFPNWIIYFLIRFGKKKNKIYDTQTHLTKEGMVGIDY